MPTKAPVKGQATLDAANARRNAKTQRQTQPPPEPDVPDLSLAVIDLGEDATPDIERMNAVRQLVMTAASGFTQPKSLGALEKIIESNVEHGAAYWRKAADALLAVKQFKLWKGASHPTTAEKYTSFVDYAEKRFGFKKTYAYDLVKAAQRKPTALTEGEARAELKAERGQKPLTPQDFPTKLQRVWERFENASGELRDRVALDEENDEFVVAIDGLFGTLSDHMLAFMDRYTPIPGQTLDTEADSVRPLRGQQTLDAEDADDDADDDDGDDDDGDE